MCTFGALKGKYRVRTLPGLIWKIQVFWAEKRDLTWITIAASLELKDSFVIYFFFFTKKDFDLKKATYEYNTTQIPKLKRTGCVNGQILPSIL